MEGGGVDLSSDKWKQEHTVRYSIRFTDGKGELQALKQAAKERGITESQFIRRATIEKLKTDGLLTEQKDACK